MLILMLILITLPSNSAATASKLAIQQLELQEKNAKDVARFHDIEQEKNILQLKLTNLLGNTNSYTNTNNTNTDIY